MRTGASVKVVGSSGSGHTTADVVVHALGTVFAAASLAIGDYVKGCFFRIAGAGNADDTLAQTITPVGVKFKGTKKKRTA